MTRVTRQRGALALAGAFTLTCVVAQVVQVPGILDPKAVISLHLALRTVHAGTAAMVAIVLWALFAPRRTCWLAAAAPAAAALLILAVCLVGSGHLGSAGAAALTMAACWEAGERTLTALGARRLAGVFAVAWTAGAAVLSMALLAAGLAHALRWWTAGVVVVAIGLAGSRRLAGLALARRHSFVAAVTRTRLSVACFGLIAGWLAAMAILCAAPETGYDALAIKAWLPLHWALTGSIRAIPLHVQTTVTGSAQLLAIGGHLFGAHDTGRWLQYLTVPALGATAWWWGERHGPLGPIAGLAAVACPAIVYQSGTAYDDLLLMLGAAGLALGVHLSLSDDAGPQDWRAGAAVGVLAGAVVDLKLHLLGLAIGLSAAYLVAARPRAALWPRAAGLLGAAAAVCGLPFLARWFQYDNPVFPSYNNVFKSDQWAHVNEHFNLPFWSHPDRLGILDWPWRALHTLNPINEAAPPNMLGMLLATTVAAFVLGPLVARTRATVALWVGVAVALLFWWTQLRYLRYLLPTGFVALLLTFALVRVHSLRGGRELAVIAVAGVFAVAAFPAALAGLTAEPNHDLPYAAAVGHWPKNAWLDSAFAERRPIQDFERITPPRSAAFSNAYQRIWLHGGRDLVGGLDIIGTSRGAGIPQTATALRPWLHGKGVDWVLTDGQLVDNGRPWARDLVGRYATLVHADANWILYRLAAHPAPLRPVACDTLQTTRLCAVPSCPGQTVGVDLTVPRDGQQVDVSVVQVSPNTAAGRSVGHIPAGHSGRVAATGPPGTTQTAINVTPPEAPLSRLRLFAAGSRCGA